MSPFKGLDVDALKSLCAEDAHFGEEGEGLGALTAAVDPSTDGSQYGQPYPGLH